MGIMILSHDPAMTDGEFLWHTPVRVDSGADGAMMEASRFPACSRHSVYRDWIEKEYLMKE